MPTWTGLGANNNWSTVGNWDIAVPTSATTALFTGVGVSGSKNCTITAGAACSLLSCSGYLGTMSLANNLTVVGNLTLGSGMTITGSAGISKTGNGTLISNGVTLGGSLLFAGGGGTAHTFGSNWIIDGNFGDNVNSNTVTGGGYTASIGGNLSGLISTTNFLFQLRGTGTLSGTHTGNTIASATIQISSSAGVITQSTSGLSTFTFTYITGSYISTGIMTIGGLGVTFNNVSGIVFSDLAFAAAAGQTLTLNSNVYVSRSLSGGSLSGAINGPYAVYVGGNLTPSAGLTGTSTIEMSGSANASISAGTIQNNLTINKSVAAIVTFPAGTVTWGAAARTLTYTAGTINTSTSTFTIPVNTNVTMNAMPFYNLTLPGLATYTISSPITISNNLTLGSTGNVTFTGSAGWTCANLICSNTSRTITLANSSSGASYRTTTSASLTATAALPITMTSNNATTRSLWTLDYGANQSLIYVSGTRIDSSLGQTIWTFGGLRIDTVNWATGSRPGTSAYTFVN